MVENGQTYKQTNNNKQTNKQTIRQYRFTQSLGKGILRFTNMYQRTIMNGFWCNSFHVPCENIITSICDSSMMQMMLPIWAWINKLDAVWGFSPLCHSLSLLFWNILSANTITLIWKYSVLSNQGQYLIFLSNNEKPV